MLGNQHVSDENDSADIVIITLVLDDDKFVFQRRSNDAPSAPGMLGFFGGHIQYGEDSAAAAKRELEEETSLRVNIADMKLVAIYSVADDNHSQKKIYRYDLYINDAAFEVYEGLRLESYSKEQLLQRDDVIQEVTQIMKGELRNEL